MGAGTVLVGELVTVLLLLVVENIMLEVVERDGLLLSVWPVLEEAELLVDTVDETL